AAHLAPRRTPPHTARAQLPPTTTTRAAAIPHSPTLRRVLARRTPPQDAVTPWARRRTCSTRSIANRRHTAPHRLDGASPRLSDSARGSRLPPPRPSMHDAPRRRPRSTPPIQNVHLRTHRSTLRATSHPPPPHPHPP